jgi:hypothetical protein
MKPYSEMTAEEKQEFAVIMVCQINHEPPIVPEEDFFEIGLAKTHGLIEGDEPPFKITELGKQAMKEILEELEEEE